MHAFEFYMPTRIVFGPESEKKVGTLCVAQNAKKVLVIYGSGSAKRSGLIDRVEASIREAGLEVLVLGGVVANPLLSTAEDMRKAGQEFGADFLVAVGGGSVIDTAKAVAHGLANPGTPIWDFYCAKQKVTCSTPVGAVLTISAAGSETSDSSVLTNDLVEPHYKRGVNTPFNRPMFAVMNPELTATLPKYQIASGAADIFMHTCERYFCNPKGLGNVLTDGIAEALLRTVIGCAKTCVEHPADYDAMSELMWCGSISHDGLTGLGCSGGSGKEGDWAVHQLGQAISALYNATHGASLTAVWKAWAEYVAPSDYSRFASLGRNVFGIREENDETAAKLAIEAAVNWFASIGMPINLPELMNGRAYTDEELVALTENCTYARTRTIGAFKVLGFDDILSIYRSANG